MQRELDELRAKAEANTGDQVLESVAEAQITVTPLTPTSSSIGLPAMQRAQSFSAHVAQIEGLDLATTSRADTSPFSNLSNPSHVQHVQVRSLDGVDIESHKIADCCSMYAPVPEYLLHRAGLKTYILIDISSISIISYQF